MAFSLEEINYRTVADPKGMIEEADEIYEQKIAKAARMILENRKKSPIVLLSGPSGSGKTTTAMKISRALEERGVRTHYVAMDDYFNTVRPETVPRTPEGEMDLESPLCLDMELLNSHFTELAQGKRIYVPKYEFSRQMRIQEPSKSIKLKKDEIVVFEGIHALNDMITTVRDYLFRGADPNQTISMWANVRRGEQNYITPFMDKADYQFDTAFPYELPVMNETATQLFQTIPQGVERFDELKKVFPALLLFGNIDSDLVASDALIREFIGGGIYEY